MMARTNFGKTETYLLDSRWHLNTRGTSFCAPLTYVNLLSRYTQRGSGASNSLLKNSNYNPKEMTQPANAND